MKFDEVVKIIKEKKFLSENWVNKHYPDFHFFIYNLFIEDISWKAKLYLYSNNIEEVPRCYCGNLTKYERGIYRKWCSTKCSSNDPAIKEKRTNTNIKKYGFKIPLNNPDIRRVIIEKWIDNYGFDNPSKSDLVKDRVKKTNLEKWGVEYHSQLNSVKSNLSIKMKRNREKISKGKRVSISNSLVKKVSQLDISFLEIKEMSVYEFYCQSCKSEFIIHKNTLNDRIRGKNTICTNCNKISNMDSDSERLLFEFIKDNYSGLIIRNDRSLLNGKELDIYLPEINLAVEFNGIWWHSEIYKNRDYHSEKSRLCMEVNLNLIHIWEDQWINNRELIKSSLLNILKTSDIKIREVCEELEVYNDDESLGFLKFTLNKDCFQILDMCTLYKYLIPIKDYILSKYNPGKISIRHSLDWGFSRIYEDNGFKQLSSGINYFKIIENKRFFSDDDEYLGIYDSGYIEYELLLN